jgi:hypothetical protein
MFFAVLLGVPCCNIVLAQQAPAVGDLAICDKFPRRVAREGAWFANKALARRNSGARLRKIDRAVELSLQPKNRITLFLPPEVEPRDSSYSGEVTFFGVPKPGLYQVTLSDEASVDVFENGVRLKTVDSTISKTCLGVLKSVRFELAPGALVLVEISNAPNNLIKVAFAQARSRIAW